MNKKNAKKKGFTLIELIVVIAILGVIAAIAIPRFVQVQNNSRIGADISSAQSVVKAAKIYIADNNLTSDAEVATVTIDKLVTAKLIDAAPVAQTNKTAMILAVSGSAANPTFTVKTSDANVILPNQSGNFIK